MIPERETRRGIVAAAVRRKNLNRVRRVEALFQRLAVAQIAHFDLHERAQIARRAMLGLHDEMGLAVELDDLAFADVVGCWHDGIGSKVPC